MIGQDSKFRFSNLAPDVVAFATPHFVEDAPKQFEIRRRFSGVRTIGSGTLPSIRTASEAQHPDIVDEEVFQAMIAFERKRSERSQGACALILVAADDDLPADERKHLLQEISTALTPLTRDTDWMGWHKTNSVLGIIFTEIGIREKNEVVPILLGKVSGTLYEKFAQETFGQVSISIHSYPEDWQLEVSKRPSNPTLYPDLASRDQSKKLSIAIKRMMDVAGATAALILAAPLFLLIAVAIKLTSRGPVFFRQQRIGQHGKPFVILKFRSMRVNNDASVHKQWFQNFYSGNARQHATGNGSASYKLPHDPRVTRVGRLLRRTSLDEMPQFINVLRGEMSLVGPRPPIPYEVDAYKAWHRGRILQAKPGVTGLWQVSGRSRVAFNEMVRLDLQYARTWSIWLDMKILLKTPAAVLFGEGAY